MKNSYLRLRRPAELALRCILPLSALASTGAVAAELPKVDIRRNGVAAQTITGRVIDEKGQGCPALRCWKKALPTVPPPMPMAATPSP
ncbi:hypothetical protein MUN84_15440 [Hymenobacter sp. 5516J-16]|uniref:hypothetical protein n=1 Tax=Hymenobacter sp. 5516J-16 TaxID=2932253 RepID=UPI001FD46104|nr:hypothetical protein [Hymenobacter sp. 5516J-16]UOQ76003.1 hypothetical protein MUN84_15440 [Hymenobacter sp. 5516J-16]